MSDWLQLLVFFASIRPRNSHHRGRGRHRRLRSREYRRTDQDICKFANRVHRKAELKI